MIFSPYLANEQEKKKTKHIFNKLDFLNITISATSVKHFNFQSFSYQECVAYDFP